LTLIKEKIIEGKNPRQIRMFLIRNHRNPQYPIAERSIAEIIKNRKLVKANGNEKKEQVTDRI
jgi:hypothetical protein